MRYAVVTDIHGDTPGLRAVLAGIERQGVDALLCLGDVFDCLVGKADVPRHVFRSLDGVFDADPELGTLLADARTVRGNQEERITGLVPPSELPDWALPLLFADTEIRTDRALYRHGHLMRWREPEPGVWSPVPGPGDPRLLLHGHHHRSALHLVGPGDEDCVRVPFGFGREIPLEPGRRYVVNVGPVRGPRPAWAVLDEEASVLTHHRVGDHP
ncbi:metallophosphoesterase [Nocardiopsis sp. CC223A]|uniref:metallophosphoesterase family protein n=1 Tax=Nocardiopsis sp. CC223A TaxID=3044051 RepID=UPI00278BD645|nr:metallophosphoesterase family protein [Nocardiopsis sp. CC223A]